MLLLRGVTSPRGMQWTCEHSFSPTILMLRVQINTLLAERQALLEKWGPTVTLNDEAAPDRADMSAEDAERLAAVRARLAELMSVWTDTGYKVGGCGFMWLLAVLR